MGRIRLKTLSRLGVVAAVAIGVVAPVAHAATAGQVTTLPVVAGETPFSATLAGDGDYWYSADSLTSSGDIGQVTPGGVATTIIPSATSEAGQLLTGPEGDVWELVGEFTRTSGSPIFRFGLDGTETRFDAPGSYPNLDSITFGPGGDIWYLQDPTGTAPLVGRFSPADGSFNAFPSLPAAFDNSNAGSIVSGPDGALWFEVFPAGGATTGPFGIARFTTGGTATLFPYPANVVAAGPLVPTADGLWFVAFTASGSVIDRLSTDGHLSTFAVPTAAPQPTGEAAAGGDGNVWFETGTADIARITPSGAVTQFPLPDGTDFNQDHVSSLSSASNGDVLLADDALNVIELISTGSPATTTTTTTSTSTSTTSSISTTTTTSSTSTSTSTTTTSTSTSTQAAPVVTGVRPRDGRGGTLVIVTGRNLHLVSDVRFGPVQSPDWFVLNHSLMLALAPPHAPGSVHVTLTTPGGTSAPSAADVFTYDRAVSRRFR